MGVIAVFSLVAIASLSFVLMSKTGNIKVAADIESPKQCIDNPNIETSELVVTVSTSNIKIINAADTPDEQLKITFSDVSGPKITGYSADFTSGVKVHQAVLDLGTQKAGEEIVIPFSYSKSGNLPCLQVEASSNGIAFSPETAVFNLP